MSALATPTAIRLRPYQQEGIAAVEQALARGITRPLVVQSTGTGKTVSFSHLIQKRGGTALILAHRDELLQQAADKLVRVAPELALSIGFVKGEQNDTHAPIVIASVQTLARAERLAQLPTTFTTGIVDEAHHASSPTYVRIMEHLAPTPLIAGYTATAERNDNKHLANVWQEVVFEYGLLEAIRDGYLVEPRGIRVSLDVDLSTVKQTGGDFQDGALGQALMNADAPRHVVASWREHASDRKTIVFVPTVEMAHIVAATFRTAGVTAEAVDGETPTDERRDRLARFSRGHTQVLANVGVLTEGYDEPSVGCIVVARPTKSRPLFTQIVGRGLRTYPGKDDCLVLDVTGVTDKLSLFSVPRLLGLKEAPRDGESVADAFAREQYEAAQADLSGPDGNLVAERVNLLAEQDRGGRKELHWIKAGDMFLLSLGGSTLELEPDASGAWSVIESMPTGRTTLASGIDLGYAHGMAEDLVRERKSHALANPDAAWRRAKPKPPQVNYAKRLGITVTDEMSRGELSDLITARVAERDRRKRVAAGRR